MKVLYVVNAIEQKCVSFYASQIMEEKQDKFILLDKIKIDTYPYNSPKDKINADTFPYSFPKDKINVEFDMGYVTDNLDKKVLRSHLDRIYNKLKEIHLNNKDILEFEFNNRYYKSSINLLDRCVTPEEYEKNLLNNK